MPTPSKHSPLRGVSCTSGLLLAGLVGLSTLTFSEEPTALVVSFVAMIMYLAADAAEPQQRRNKAIFDRNLLRSGALLLAWIFLGLVIRHGLDQPLTAAIAFTAFSAASIVHSWLARLPQTVYVTAGGLAGAIYYFQVHLGISDWIVGLLVLAVIFLLVSHILVLRKAGKIWIAPVRQSSFALAGIVAMLGFDFATPVGVFTVALAATLFAIEAWQREAVWAAIIADLVYIEAFFLVLVVLNINEPQYFSTGAAAIGLVLHYLLRRFKEARLTYLAGLVSQLALLGTSYMQMIATQNLEFFFLLFFQGLAVAAYGTVIRSRSLVTIPIGFVVLGVISVVIRAFSNFLTLIVIACSGLVLLILGISALFLRERIGKASERLRSRLADWSA